MKLVKAYVRHGKAEEVIDALEAIGISGVTLIDVMGIGSLADPDSSKYSLRIIKTYSEVAKLEIVCADKDVERVTEAVREKAYTGMPGDGIIYVAGVEEAVKIRTGETGEGIL